MSNQQPNHRSLTGFVTKLVGDGATYGFINEEIFFPQTNVTGGPATVGDQVFAECEYSAHLPIKWNATSVKILNKVGAQHPPNNPSVSERPQQQPQQDMIPPQHLQQFNNQQQNVAVTYQQHRQQRQQRQILDAKQQQQSNNSLNKQTVNQGAEPQVRMLDQGNNQSEFFSQNQRSFPQQPQLQHQQQAQQADSNMQPFQDQPMGPPNFAYTSQLGSAFVQNQFVPAPFMPQQAPPMLSQQQQQQQHLLPQNNQMHNQSNQRHNQQHNKGMGGRFNDSKNDRQNRRNQNRNDDKYDGPRDRDGSRNRLSKSNGSRERSLGHGSKRDDVPTRLSPPPHSSARSTTSMGSDRGAKSRKHYEINNIPKSAIMTNMNAYNMKQRCPSSVHVPSDLKDIIVNRYFRLDIKNMPKPIKFALESAKKEITTDQEHPKEVKESETSAEVTKSEEEGAETQDIKSGASEENEGEGENKNEEKSEVKSAEQSTASSKSDVKLSHKYGVKVVLISMPELETIYRKVFGDNYDSFASDNKLHVRLDEVISLLCNKGSNNGHSLVGGKFDPSLDGFIEGEQNEYERHKKQPDLIATCKRVVLDQTGIDLSECRSWTLLATFLYNNKSDYFSTKASVEYSFIYIPQIWTMLKDHFDKNVLNKESTDLHEQFDTQDAESSMGSRMEVEESGSILPQDMNIIEQEEPQNPVPSLRQGFTPSISVGNLSELKVTDLKIELDRRNVKYKGGAKKAELVALLSECLQPSEQSQNESQETVQDEEKGEEKSIHNEEAEDAQLEEGEVAETDAEACVESPIPDMAPSDPESSKRKEPDTGDEGETSNKKVCGEKQLIVKEEKVELITESFKVISRDGQQQLSLVSLHEATQAGRYDQFELSVSSNLLKESLIQHLSEYILTVLVEDNRQKSSGGNLGTTSSLSSQETTSDTNNNSKSSFKNPSASNSEQKVNLKELPVDRYINLAFTYFDSTHMGYIHFEDLNKLFNNTGLTISKRALISLVGEGEKVNYRTIPDLSVKLSPTYIYEYPGQFTRLPIASSLSSFDSDQPSYKSKVKMIEYKGVSYDIEKLIQQVRDAETLRVSLVDRFNYAIENSDKQAEEIHVLEVSQKSLAKAIKAQNDEICDLKRERDSIKKRYESVRKGIKGATTMLSDILKEDK